MPDATGQFSSDVQQKSKRKTKLASAVVPPNAFCAVPAAFRGICFQGASVRFTAHALVDNSGRGLPAGRGH